MSIIDNLDFTHPYDRKTRSALEAVPGFSDLKQAYARLVNDQMIHMNNMSSKILLGPEQLPEIYDLLPPVCERLGIEQPPLYLELSAEPRAYTRGGNLPEITVTSGLLDHMTSEEVQIALARECGHILCHHVTYHQIGEVVMRGMLDVVGLPIIGPALDYALLNWMRCSEFSADRAAALFAGGSEKVVWYLLRSTGCSQGLDDSIDAELFANQATHFKGSMDDPGWNQFLAVVSYIEGAPTLNAVRANEVARWAEYSEVQEVLDSLESGELKPTVTHFNEMAPSSAGQEAVRAGACPQCGAPNPNGSAFCFNCGFKFPAMVFCSQCGSQNAAGVAFCAACGQPISAGRM